MAEVMTHKAAERSIRIRSTCFAFVHKQALVEPADFRAEPACKIHLGELPGSVRPFTKT